MPYILATGSTYTTSHTNYQTYSHETDWCDVVEYSVKLKALESRAGLALNASQIADGEPDRPTETLVVKWQDLK